MLLNKNNLKDALAPKTKVVSFPEFEVKIKKVGVSDVLAIQKIDNKENMEQLIIETIKRCCVDDSNELLFTEEDVKELPLEVATVLFQECFDYNLNVNVEKRAKNS